MNFASAFIIAYKFKSLTQSKEGLWPYLTLYVSVLFIQNIEKAQATHSLAIVFDTKINWFIGTNRTFQQIQQWHFMTRHFCQIFRILNHKKALHRDIFWIPKCITYSIAFPLSSTTRLLIRKARLLPWLSSDAPVFDFVYILKHQLDASKHTTFRIKTAFCSSTINAN